MVGYSPIPRVFCHSKTEDTGSCKLVKSGDFYNFLYNFCPENRQKPSVFQKMRSEENTIKRLNIGRYQAEKE